MSVTVYIFMGLSEMIIGFGFGLVSGMSIQETQENPFTFALGTLSSKFMAYFFSLIIRNSGIDISNRPLQRNMVLLFSLPAATLLIMLVFLMGCYKIDELSYRMLIVVASIVMLFANIMVFEIISRQNKSLEAEIQLSFYEKYLNSQKQHYEELYKHENEMSKFRHNTKTILLSLIGLIKAGESEKALEVMEKNVGVLSGGAVVNSRNPVVDALLQAKSNLARENGIELSHIIRIEEPIEIDEIELGIIIGNALDNAIEATQKITENERKRIDFRMMSLSSLIAITVENPIEENIDTGNLSTTKSDKALHGYGVQSIKSIAERYGGSAEFECKDRKFLARISMVNK